MSSSVASREPFLLSMKERCIHGLPRDGCVLCAELEGGLPRQVFLTAGGQVYHFRADCPNLLDGQSLVDDRGGRTEPIEQVSTKDAITAGRPPCRGCAGSILTREPAMPASDLARTNTSARETSRPPSYSLEEIRRHYPRAYESWEEQEDAYLLREFERGRTAEELSVVLGRTFGAICARLTMSGVEMPPGPGTAVA